MGMCFVYYLGNCLSSMKVSRKTKLVTRRLLKAEFLTFGESYEISYQLWQNLENHSPLYCGDHSILVTRILILSDTVPCFPLGNKTALKKIIFFSHSSFFIILFFISRQSFYHCSVLFSRPFFTLTLMSFWPSIRPLGHTPVLSPPH